MLVFNVLKILTGGIAFLARAFVMLQIAGGPILWIIEAIALAAYLIYRNWDTIGPYFQRAWGWVKQKFIEFYAWAEQWIDNLMPVLVEKLKAAWEGLKGWFADLWKGIVGTFDDLLKGIEQRIAEVKAFLGMGGQSQPGSLPGQTTNPPPAPDNAMDLLFHNGAYRPGAGGTGGGSFGYPALDINIKADDNLKVDAPKRLQPMDLGNMTSRA